MEILHKSVTVTVRYLLSFWKAVCFRAVLLCGNRRIVQRQKEQEVRALSAFWRQRFFAYEREIGFKDRVRYKKIVYEKSEADKMTQRKTGLEDYYILKNNKKLHYGYTTGTCAAAASKAAVEMLLSGHTVDEVELMTPKGIRVFLEIEEISIEKDKVCCAVRKDGGDDPDATHGILIFSTVKKIPDKKIAIDGGSGVGRVTKKGLEQPVGSAAINRVPREMIANEVKEICEAMGYEGGISIEISVPEGKEIAKKTFNPKLGIEGGISILGTSGIVIPMSEEALIASIRVEMEMKRANGAKYLLITPGNYGADFCQSELKLNLDHAMKCSNYVGETIDMAVSLGIKGILFVAHIGKFIKVAGGIMNTHSRCADSRAEIMASNAVRAGSSLETVKRLLDTVTTDEAVSILNETGETQAVMEKVTEKIRFYLQNRANGMIETEAVIFSKEHGLLGKTVGADKLLEKIKE